MTMTRQRRLTTAAWRAMIAAAVVACSWSLGVVAAEDDEPQAPTFVMRPQGWGTCRSGGGGESEAKGLELTRNGGFEFGQAGWLVRERQPDPAGGSQPTQVDVRPDITTSAAYLSPEVLAATPPAQREGLGLELRLPYGMPRERYVSQSLDTPVELTGLTISFRYRIDQAYPDGSPTRMRALIQRLRAQDELWSRDFSADLTATPDASPLEDGWLRFEARVTDAAALAEMSGSRATSERGPLVLRFVAIGQGVVLQLDDVSVKADGTIRWPDAPGRLAYAVERPGRAPGYAIQCVSPDGQSRSELFLAIGFIEGLRWQPRPRRAAADPQPAAKPAETAAQSALAIVSSHDPALSNWRGDVYMLNAQSLRRLTHPHTLSSLATTAPSAPAGVDLPTGQVRGLIHNPNPYFLTAQVHVQGAKAPAMLTLRPQQTAAFELTEVADLGDVEQFVVVRTRRAAFEAPWRVDVKARATVDLPDTIMVSATYTAHSVGQLAFEPAGASLLLNTEEDTISRLRVDGPDAQPVRLPINGSDPSPSPIDGRFLLVDADLQQSDQRRILLWDADAPDARPQPIVTPNEPRYSVDMPTWLPDGGGFLYRGTACPEDASQQCTASLNLYTFQDAGSRRLALFPDEDLTGLTVSPDGRYAAFIRAMTWKGFGPKAHRSLWIISLERPSQRWLIDAKGQPSLPDWSAD
jgi:hypothetical protein